VILIILKFVIPVRGDNSDYSLLVPKNLATPLRSCLIRGPERPCKSSVLQRRAILPPQECNISHGAIAHMITMHNSTDWKSPILRVTGYVLMLKKKYTGRSSLGTGASPSHGLCVYSGCLSAGINVRSDEPVNHMLSRGNSSDARGFECN
jgi:hypothetical protein